MFDLTKNVRHNEVNSHNIHVLYIQLRCGETIVGNNGVGELFGGLNESIERWLGLLFVDLQ